MAGTRRYTSELRAERVRATRRRVLDAAGILFVTEGYAGTTLDAIAGKAGVSTQTVYNAVGGKAIVLKAVYDVALAGDDEPVAVADRPAFQALLAEPDSRRFFARYAALGRQMGERVVELVALVTAQAATGDRDLREFVETIERERALGTAGVARLAAERFGLRPGLSVTEAADILWTFTGPELWDRLVRQRRWTWDRFEAWLAQMMVDALVGDVEGGR